MRSQLLLQRNWSRTVSVLVWYVRRSFAPPRHALLMSPHPLRLVQFGLGPIGLGAARVVLKKAPALHLVGAIDVDSEKAGRDLAELLDLPEETGVVVSPDTEGVLREARPDVVLHTTSSFLPAVADQLETCLAAGVHVISSTEELAYPFDRYPELADRLDRAGQASGRVLLGTGVNPGFAMDTLALTATAPCAHVHAVHVERVVDAGQRRLSLQRKVGAGLTEAAFREKAATGTFGHIGLVESLRVLTAGLGWKVDAVKEWLEPVLAEHEVTTPFLTVRAGEVAGIHHRVEGRVNGHAALTLDLKMYVGAENARDAVLVDGDPPIDLVVHGGIFGDTATCALLVNMAPLVMEAKPGLRTMADMPVPRAFGTALAG